ncbi:hypothetical protein AVEN_86815-1 [Araneus ventricosus]|uniref:Reverse transcriptase domain-containing protein n=1 Tax=Araneus ventricosus TaxID=182803 RepID=A0A4Y2CZP2_ARAVE|nr:hypothetical protein AVEN_86815-1 [Araneus ventricosus]
MTSLRTFLTVKPLDMMALINIIVKVIFNSFPFLLLDFFNKCLELKCFPNALKIGLVILFHKTGKDEHNINSYRPISLLPTLGKLLEKLLLQSFNFQLKTKKLQHALLYGFREGKSVDNALLHATSLLEQARRQKKHAVLIYLDISNAFDSLQYSSIRDRFASFYLFSNITETLLDTLRNRKVALQTSEGLVLWKQTRDVHRVHEAGQHFGTSWQTKSYRYNGVKEFIYKHSPMTLRSSL